MITRKPKIEAWSASRVFAYETCPAIPRYRYIDKLPEVAGDPLIRGSRIHAEGEAYLKAKPAIKIPKSYDYVKDELRALRRKKAISEEQWGFDRDWNITSWWGATIRMVLDAHVVRGFRATVVDFKTGKPRPKDEDQVGLYASGAFAMFPKIRTVTGQVWYLDLGSIIELRFNKKEAMAEREQWEARAQKMLDDDVLAPTPNYTCKWCVFGKSKGGPCEAEK